MLSTLFGCGGMRHGSHHLYDDIDKPPGQGQAPTTNVVDDDARDEDFD